MRIGDGLLQDLSYAARLLLKRRAGDYELLRGRGDPGVALVASYVPARRAMNVDPIVALRYE